MTASRECASGRVGIDVPSVARVYDYLLGGGHNFPADRALAERISRLLPDVELIASANRAFLRRAVLHMVGRGITQFLDLGSGIPTVGNVHEVARRAAPGARVVYVDHDEVAVAHTELILDGDPDTAVVHADICAPWRVLGSPEVVRLLDFRRPIGLLMVAVLHYVPDKRDPRSVVAAYRDAVPSGSALAISHGTADHRPEITAAAKILEDSLDPAHPRPYDEIAALFTGFDVVPPGVVSAPLWRPDLRRYTHNGPDDLYAGLGVKA
ncbi:MAG TPA: SAM-dependent methyltransferase [Actinophytocola sp.]|uniref:SAM-dependent methyltransferase n=1 Tax=Actinophytocola sp. TaxID=1872138 RepID=UPI002DBDDC14|nr:SAM-dependent methyltransferase [Actinophytocola sp.]HEU5472891.1 SAM-dependent methyltransferase [Actinophytocola sp.]